MEEKIFAAYSDESGCFDKRYQAISVVSGNKNILSNLRSKLRDVLINKRIKEVKFAKIKTNRRMIEAAQAFIEECIKFAKQNNIRIDVLVWDMQDYRHSVQRRDNVANLEFMYYKVLRHISEKWRQIDWEFYPDEKSEINWQIIINFLNITKMPRLRPNILTLFEQERYQINFAKVMQIQSHKEPAIQIADLFAGMACFTRYNGEECVKWLKSQELTAQPLLFSEKIENIERLSKKKCNRYNLIGMLYDICKNCRLGVSLNTKKYLWTRNPSNPINFWNYEPQRIEDRAPTK